MKLSTPKTREEIERHSKDKEYRDFVYYTVQTLNKLTQGLEALNNAHDAMFKKHQSLHNNLSIDLENHISEVGLQIGRAFNHLDDFRSDLGDIQQEVKTHLDISNKHFVTKQDLMKSCDEIIQKQKLLEMSFNVLKNYLHSEMGVLKSSQEDKVKAECNEIRKDIPDIESARKSLEEKINMFHVDFAGVLLEIDRMKKSIRYGEKKFENLYTLIDRLKGAS